MKKVLSAMAVSAFVLTAGVALAGGPGKMAPGCPEACQQQIDDLNSSQAQQNEQLGAHSKQLQNHEARITDLEKVWDDAWYGRVGVRGTWMSQDFVGMGNVGQEEVDTDMGWGGSVAFGREFSMYQSLGKFRAEVELSYQDADLEDADDASVNLASVFANAYYQIPVVDAFSVYVMAGMGYAKYELDIDNYIIDEFSINTSDNVFAYKAGIGMSYDFTDQIAGDLGYEYLGVADTDIADSINGHNIVASVRFKF